MKATVLKQEIESALTQRFGALSHPGLKIPVELLSTGIAEIDISVRGFPRGAISEVVGRNSSGRTSLLLAALRSGTAWDETCVLIDTSDRFEPAAAVNARIALERLLWIRCDNDLERAFKATDLVLQGGGFGLVVLDIADISIHYVGRILSSWWYRFRHAIENTLTTLIVISPAPCVRSCASLSLELRNENAMWLENVHSFEAVEVLEQRDADNRKIPEKFRPRLVPSQATQSQGRDSLPSHSFVLHGARVQVRQQKPAISRGPVMFTVLKDGPP